MDEILGGIPERAQVSVERDRARAIHAAITHAAPGDVVLVAGKGAEDYQQIGGERVPFDDREIVRTVLAARGEGGER